MKTITWCAALILLSGVAVAGDSTLPTHPVTGKIAYSGIVEIDQTMGDTWPIIYEWMIKNSHAEITQIDQGEVSKLIGKSSLQVFEMNGDFPAGHVHYTITISIRDGMFKYLISDFVHTGQLLSGNRVYPDLGPLENLDESLGRVHVFSLRRTRSYLEQQISSEVYRILNDITKTLDAGLQDAENGW